MLRRPELLEILAVNTNKGEQAEREAQDLATHFIVDTARSDRPDSDYGVEAAEACLALTC
jgi:hypothetical protein